MTAALYDSSLEDILFLRDGTPDVTTHALWRAGAIHIYRPGDWPEILVTVDPHGVRTDWPFIDPPSCPLPPHPWISYDEVTYGLADDEITAFDTWRRNPHTATESPPAHWEEYARPVLIRPPPPELTLPPRPSAPPASPQRPAPTPTPSVSVSSRHDLAVASGLPPLPPHVQRLVIDAAIAAGATCPITMEPITADTAVITPCGHVFGTTLTPRVSLCPVCRSTL
jgi:hypothetical protein